MADQPITDDTPDSFWARWAVALFIYEFVDRSDVVNVHPYIDRFRRNRRATARRFFSANN